jgi:hypothetical protein
MQTKLSSFFSVNIEYNPKNKKCFVYEPSESRAFFVNAPNYTDTFIVKQSGLSLYLRSSTVEKYDFPTIETVAPVPLLKSNLQKAIRRGLNIIAVHTTIALCQKDPMELLRRLAIICIEDVCLMDSYPIIVWLMIADQPLKPHDIYLLLQIVNSLCNCKNVFKYYGVESHVSYTHDILQNHDAKNQLLALYYRALYGGLLGDVAMLNNAITYYMKNTNAIVKTTFGDLDCDYAEPLQILDSAIDYHPYPSLVAILNEQTQLDKNTIKTTIWHAESGYNYRKPETIAESKKYKASAPWHLIKEPLRVARMKIA